MHTYSVSLEHFLSKDELKELGQKHQPSLHLLGSRYCPSIDVTTGFPVTPIYLDHLRTQWLLDRAVDRPAIDVANSALGFAFGLLLEACTDLRWAIARDDSGTFITMGRTGEDPVFVSVPSFDFVSKRADLQSAEVFLHFFEQVPAEYIGFRKPSNCQWSPNNPQLWHLNFPHPSHARSIRWSRNSNA